MLRTQLNSLPLSSLSYVAHYNRRFLPASSHLSIHLLKENSFVQFVGFQPPLQNPKTLLLPISQPKISSFNQSMATLNSFLTNSISLSSSSILHRKFSLTKPIHLPIRAQITSSSISEKTQEKRAVSASVPAATQEIIDEEAKYMVGTYARFPVAVESGKSCKLYDFGGKEYLDMASGIAVNSLGHGNPDLNEVLMQQGNTVWHVSNVYYTQPQVKLAKRLVECTFADRVFFTNSGTEANEAAIKFARKFQRNSLSDGRKPATEFIAFTNSFHGRTMGAVALTSKQAYRLPFEPVMPGVTFVEYGNIEDAKKAIVSGKTAAVFVEPIQGEGGIYSATKEFLQSLRTACNDAGALLIYDEVQCGLGRTGQLWAHETYGVVPDIMTLAKPLAGGLPIGAVLVTEAVASAINHGDHGSTFAGSPLVCKVALKVLDKIQEPAFLASVAKKGLYFKDLLIKKLGGNPHVKEVRGLGLILGIDLDVPASPLVKACLESGLMVLTAGKGNVVRLVPPLIISEEELEYAADVLKSCLPVLDDKQ